MPTMNLLLAEAASAAPSDIVDLTLPQMIAIYAVLVLPLVVLGLLRTGLVKTTLIAFVRMTIQLVLVGLYLKVLFDLNSWLVTLLWIAVMLVTANVSIIQQAGLSMRYFFVTTLAGTTVAAISVSLLLVMAIIQPAPLFDARYVIPIFGMTLGNCMRGNVLTLERFYSSIRTSEKEFLTRQMLGATLFEAIRPYAIAALRAALAPSIAVMATMGIVSLPGMMTGQILGGSSPMTAIKYQIAIMVCIFTVTVIGALLNILLSIPKGFDKYHMLRQEIFVKT